MTRFHITMYLILIANRRYVSMQYYVRFHIRRKFVCLRPLDIDIALFNINTKMTQIMWWDEIIGWNKNEWHMPPWSSFGQCNYVDTYFLKTVRNVKVPLCPKIAYCICDTWVSWCLKSPTTQSPVSLLVQGNNKDKFKLHINCPCWRVSLPVEIILYAFTWKWQQWSSHGSKLLVIGNDFTIDQRFVSYMQSCVSHGLGIKWFEIRRASF